MPFWSRGQGATLIARTASTQGSLIARRARPALISGRASATHLRVFGMMIAAAFQMNCNFKLCSKSRLCLFECMCCLMDSTINPFFAAKAGNPTMMAIDNLDGEAVSIGTLVNATTLAVVPGLTSATAVNGIVYATMSIAIGSQSVRLVTVNPTTKRVTAVGNGALLTYSPQCRFSSGACVVIWF